MTKKKAIRTLTLRRKRRTKSAQQQISYYDRQEGKMEHELIYGDGLLRFLYESKRGQLLSGILSHWLFSRLYGLYQNTPLSKKGIPSFVKKFHIKMEDYSEEVGKEFPYKNFNEFFIREFKKGARPFVKEKGLMPAFAEGKYLAYRSIAENESYFIKGKALTIGDILKSSKWEKVFRDGPLFIARLCPVDYHRFHFPDDGEVLDYYKLKGKLHSVNPLALKKKKNIFAINERQVTILETKNFGRLAYIEVGALAVGKIKQTHLLDRPYKRGEEKGYFLFGGSTVILIGESPSKGQGSRWLPDEDIIAMTKKKIETFIRLGERVAHQQ
ncbi:MAG: phosphatidylserine decarboxylase [Oligoflexia bacterium]|nr:phosphatidylserine decarboxylase [Oligoflexia bacterium]